jgi:hypothetical protein
MENHAKFDVVSSRILKEIYYYTKVAFLEAPMGAHPS